ncbi:Plus agglutinin [Vulgatibacter incomptus]|uniref:Plus agglutinin n=1 Tax=Vulgatibacter incomptus TaxID=1391653 RepID=A0A0K1PHQ7_9BACT|nr:Plus agglutinin [Vulgatibacter incomptus]
MHAASESQPGSSVHAPASHQRPALQSRSLPHSRQAPPAQTPFAQSESVEQVGRSAQVPAAQTPRAHWSSVRHERHAPSTHAKPPLHWASEEHGESMRQAPATQLRPEPQSLAPTHSTQAEPGPQWGTRGSAAQSASEAQGPMAWQPSASQIAPGGHAAGPSQLMGSQAAWPTQRSPRPQLESSRQTTHAPVARSQRGPFGLDSQSRSEVQPAGGSHEPSTQFWPAGQSSPRRQATQSPFDAQKGCAGSRQSSSPSQTTRSGTQAPASQRSPSPQSPAPRQATHAAPSALQRGVGASQSVSVVQTVPTQRPTSQVLPAGQWLSSRQATHRPVSRSHSFPLGSNWQSLFDWQPSWPGSSRSTQTPARQSWPALQTTPRQESFGSFEPPSPQPADRRRRKTAATDSRKRVGRILEMYHAGNGSGRPPRSFAGSRTGPSESPASAPRRALLQMSK